MALSSTTMEKKPFDFDAFVKEAGEQLLSGKPLVGAEKVSRPLLTINRKSQNRGDDLQLI